MTTIPLTGAPQRTGVTSYQQKIVGQQTQPRLLSLTEDSGFLKTRGGRQRKPAIGTRFSGQPTVRQDGAPAIRLIPVRSNGQRKKALIRAKQAARLANLNNQGLPLQQGQNVVQNKSRQAALAQVKQQQLAAQQAQQARASQQAQRQAQVLQAQARALQAKADALRGTAPAGNTDAAYDSDDEKATTVPPKETGVKFAPRNGGQQNTVSLSRFISSATGVQKNAVTL